MSLLRTIMGGEQRATTVLSFQDYLDLVTSFNFGGSTYPLSLNQTLSTQTAEVIDGSFESIAMSAFRGNGVVFACERVRLSLFSEARFGFRELNDGDPGRTTGTIPVLERPWPNGTTGDLLKRSLLHADTAGTAFIVRRKGEDRLSLPRPDRITIVMGSYGPPSDSPLDLVTVGYMHQTPGGKAEVLMPDEVALFAPVPDPLASYRGMSWMAPIIRDIQSDSQATGHKVRFFENGATPNMIVTLDKEIALQAFSEWRADFEKNEPKALNAFKTLYLGGGAKAEVVGNSFQELDLKNVQGSLETRIAAASGVHPVIAALSEGLAGSSLNAGNFQSARRLVGDATLRPLWRDFAGAIESIAPPPARKRVWYYDRDIPFLREDVKDQAEIQNKEAMTNRTLTDAGYLPESVIAAIGAQDWSLLKHSGLYSVQLQPPGEGASEDPNRSAILALAAAMGTRDQPVTVTIAEGAIRSDVSVTPQTFEAGEVKVTNPIELRAPDVHVDNAGVVDAVRALTDALLNQPKPATVIATEFVRDDKGHTQFIERHMSDGTVDRQAVKRDGKRLALVKSA